MPILKRKRKTYVGNHRLVDERQKEISIRPLRFVVQVTQGSSDPIVIQDIISDSPDSSLRLDENGKLVAETSTTWTSTQW